jgi:uncharacterized protein YcbX
MHTNLMSITVSEVNIYPIKSCGGISLTSAQLEPRGFQYDRRWMLVDDDGIFLTQREYPRMALISVQLHADHLRTEAPGMPSLDIPLRQNAKEHVLVEVWGDKVQAVDVGTKASTWFSEFLGVSVRLVAMSEKSYRPVDERYRLNSDTVSFADAFPLLLISEGSLEYLNSKLEDRLPMKRFRPNMVVRGCAPHDEDNWREILIGDVKMHVVKPCARCVITTVDPETGTRTNEPLRTLATFRTQLGKVIFGQNVLHALNGTVHVGDNVKIVSTRDAESIHI